MSDTNHALFTGISPSAVRPLSLQEAQAAFDAHQAKRPDHFLAMRDGLTNPESRLYAEWRTWCAQKEILEGRLQIARSTASSKWFGAALPKAQPPQFRGFTHEDRVAHGSQGGRPRKANPSPEALRKRERRAQARARAVQG